MLRLLDDLDKLHLDELDEDWSQAIYHSEFLEIPDLPTEYEVALESLNIEHVLTDIIKSIDNWLSCNNEDDEMSWAGLSTKVDYQRLLAVLAYFISFGAKNVQTKEYRNNALLASRVYFKLLLIPGYKVFNIYHGQLFTLSLSCLSFPKELCEKDDNYLNAKQLAKEFNTIIRDLRQYTKDLQSVFPSLQLNPDDMNYEDILSNLVDIIGGAVVNKLNIDRIELSNITGVIYSLIDSLLQDVNMQPNPVAITLLFKCLLPKLVATSIDYRRSNNLAQASYVAYCGLLLSRYGKAALSGFTILLQHLCYSLDGLERAEVRSARVSLLAGLMSFLPHRSYRDTVKWILKLSTTSKISHRHIALELLAKLLNNEPEEIQEAPQQPQSQESGSNSLDEASSSNIRETEDGQELINETASQSDSITTEDESCNDLQITSDLTEEEAAELRFIKARAARVNHGAILHAVAERTGDVSSALRARSLTVLSDVVLSAPQRPHLKAALETLNAGGAVAWLIGLAVRCVSDERAAVRRAALLLLHRLLLSQEENLADDNLAVLVNLCRDASITVRAASISALGELAYRWGRASVVDALLAGPVHQLSDPETKVQEQVMSLIQNILIERLRPYSPSGCDDTLPWIFLASVAKQNMRSYLQKACTLLAKNAKCINHRLVDILSTHLGVLNNERDLHALFLLSSVAPHVEYSEVDFIMDYYYKTAKEQKDQDARLLPLTLEIITEWSQWLHAGTRAALREHLIQLLSDAECADSSRMACASLAAHLEPTNLQWATELMQTYEQRSLSGGGVVDWLGAADMSLVAPDPPSPALLKLILSSLERPPVCEDEESAEKRGCAVAALGRLCVRSRDAAAAAAPVLAALLSANAEPLPGRHNALLALADICTRYTCIVEPLLGVVCGCVARGAPSALRSAAAAALTRLLLAGYLRLRTPLYYTYCALLADEDPDVREPVEYYIMCCLPPATIYHHFVDCLFYYNKEDLEKDQILSFDARQLVYDVMLQRLSLVQRLNAQCRIARELLQQAVDVCEDGEEVSPPLAAALLDAIMLFSGPRLRLPRKPNQTNGEGVELDDLQERVTTNIVSHKMKKAVAEVVVPAVLKLHSHMRSEGGQLPVYLVRVATDLLKDYHQEIEELIDNDEELIERVSQFQRTIGEEPSFGGSRNVVTADAHVEFETPKGSRRRPARPPRTPHAPPKRALHI